MYYNRQEEDNLRGYILEELRELGVNKFSNDEYIEAISMEGNFISKNRTKDLYAELVCV